MILYKIKLLYFIKKVYNITGNNNSLLLKNLLVQFNVKIL